MNLQNRIKPIVALLGAAALTIAALPASAATYCNANGTPNADGLTVGEMTLNTKSANDCYGVVTDPNNINTAADLNNLGLTWGTNFQLLADTGGSTTGSFGGFDFTLSATGIGSTSGDWLLTASDPNGPTPPNLPVSLDLVGALKASDRFALYFFDDISVAAGDNNGTWEISFKKNRDFPDLSHLVLFVRNGNGGPPFEIPEPASLGLLGFGLVSLAAIRRRRII